MQGVRWPWEKGLPCFIHACILTPPLLPRMDQIAQGADRLIVDINELRNRRQAAIRRQRANSLRVQTLERELVTRKTHAGTHGCLLCHSRSA
jgi:hypothetical protein